MSAADFWNNRQQAEQTGKQARVLRDTITAWETLVSQAADLGELHQLAVEESDADTLTEVETELGGIAARIGEFEFRTMLSDEDDPTPLDEQDTVAELFQSYVDPSLVAFISVVADPTNTDPDCEWDPFAGDEGEGAEVSSALSGFLALSGIPPNQQARVDICQTVSYEFDDAFNVFSAVCG